jgi:hypothetical protein
VVTTATRSQRLGWRTAWRIAGKISFEVLFSSALAMGHGALRSVEMQVEKARRNARVNKFMVSALIAMLASAFGVMIWGVSHGFFDVDPDLAWITIALSVSVFALICFGFLVFWGIMISTSYISTGAPSIGLYLPLSRADAGRLALLGYLRLFDAQIIAIIVAFPVAYYVATLSVLGALACLGVFLITAALATTAMLLLALFFYSRIQAVGGSRVRSVIRLVFIILWAIAIMGFSFSLQLMPILFGAIEALAYVLQPIWHLLALLFPFALGTLVVQGSPIPGSPVLWYVPLAVLAYACVGWLGVRWSANFLISVGLGGVVQAGPNVVRPVTVKLSRVGVALIRKDVRVALRTPGQAVGFFMPVLMMLPVLLNFLQDAGALRVLDVLVLVTTPTMILSPFAIFFLGFETRGMAYTMTLPLRAETILRAKTRLITCMSVSIPLLMVAVSFLRPLTTPVSVAIAASQCAVVYTSSFISLALFTRVMGGGRLIGFDITQNVVQTFGIGVVSAAFTLIPVAFYGVGWLVVVAVLALPIDLAHVAGLAAMWGGIALNHLLGKAMARAMLHS